jgi:hypothetical protein
MPGETVSDTAREVNECKDVPKDGLDNNGNWTKPVETRQNKRRRLSMRLVTSEVTKKTFA